MFFMAKQSYLTSVGIENAWGLAAAIFGFALVVTTLIPGAKMAGMEFPINSRQKKTIYTRLTIGLLIMAISITSLLPIFAVESVEDSNKVGVEKGFTKNIEDNVVEAADDADFVLPAGVEPQFTFSGIGFAQIENVVVVASVSGAANRLGAEFRVGDRVLRVSTLEVETVDQARLRLQRAKRDDWRTIRLTILRNGRTHIEPLPIDQD